MALAGYSCLSVLLPAASEVGVAMGDLESLTPDERIAAVRRQSMQADEANRDVGIATFSHEASLAAGFGLAARGGWVGVATFGAAVGGGYLGAQLAQATHMDEHMANDLQAVGFHRVAAGGPNAATVGDQVAHTYGFGGFLASLAIGALAALAVGALIVFTAGAGAALLIGAAAAGGFAAGFLGGPLQKSLSRMGSQCGPVRTGSRNTYINKKKVARMTDLVACGKESEPVPLVEGCRNIFVNGLPMVRVGHKVSCGATVDQGSPNVHLNNTTAFCGVPAPDVPLWASVAGDWIFFLPLGKAASSLGRLTWHRAKLNAAQIVRDNLAATIGKSKATVTGGYNTKTGEVAARANGGGRCAEDHVVDALGGDKSAVRFTSAIRPRTGQQVPVCERCEANYGRDPFPAGTQFKSDK